MTILQADLKLDLPLTDKNWAIAEVERETGLGKDTLRVWERRYGFPQPLRDKSGDRAYPHEQLQRLRLLKRLLDAGYRPGKVVPLSQPQLLDLIEGSGTFPAGGSERAAKLAGFASALEDAQTWVQWLSSDRADLIRHSIQQHILRQGLGPTVDRLVAPLCMLVGQAWMRGEVSIYQEHLFTETLQSVLREAIASVNAGGRALHQSPRVLLTTTPTEQHGLGLLMAECHFALESCERFVLGTSTPIAEIVLAVRQLNIDVLALSFSACASRREVLTHLQSLLAQLPSTTEVWVGGAAAAAHQRALPEPVVLMRTPGDVVGQVHAWRQGRMTTADSVSAGRAEQK